jgi:hypothetical protein
VTDLIPPAVYFCSPSWIVSKFWHLFLCQPFASLRVAFSGHWLWPTPVCRLAQVRNHPWTCENDTRHPPCSLMFHHAEIYIEHTYKIVTMPMCTQLGDWIWVAEQGLHLVQTGLQLHAGTGACPSTLSHSIEKLPQMTFHLMWGCGKQARITRLHCTCQVVCMTSWSEKSSSAGGERCRSPGYGGGRASGGCSLYRDFVSTNWILGEHGATRVQHRLPWCWHHWASYIGFNHSGGGTW